MVNIKTNPENCTGCLICQLQCSFQYYKEFNPSKSKIFIIQSEYDTRNIDFADDCKNCGICAEYCAYGALIIDRKGDNKIEN